MRKCFFGTVLFGFAMTFYYASVYMESNYNGYQRIKAYIPYIESIDTLFKTNPDEPRIFCMILTHSGNLNTRTKAVYQAWATKCDNHKFISVIPDEWTKEAKMVVTNETKLMRGFELTYQNMTFLQPINYTIDRYNKLTDKMFQTFKYMYLNYKKYDWYLKADDDTFVFIDNLRAFLRNKNSSSPVTYGWDFHCYVNYGYHSGGAGYVLSHEAMTRIGSKLVDNYTFCKYNGGIEVKFSQVY